MTESFNVLMLMALVDHKPIKKKKKKCLNPNIEVSLDVDIKPLLANAAFQFLFKILTYSSLDNLKFSTFNCSGFQIKHCF